MMHCVMKQDAEEEKSTCFQCKMINVDRLQDAWQTSAAPERSVLLARPHVEIERPMAHVQIDSLEESWASVIGKLSPHSAAHPASDVEHQQSKGHPKHTRKRKVTVPCTITWHNRVERFQGLRFMLQLAASQGLCFFGTPALLSVVQFSS